MCTHKDCTFKNTAKMLEKNKSIISIILCYQMYEWDSTMGMDMHTIKAVYLQRLKLNKINI